MKLVALEVSNWMRLNEKCRRRLLLRPARRHAEQRVEEARGILRQVRKGGDAALMELTVRLDGVRLESPEVAADEIDAADAAVPAADRAALDAAIATVGAFHKAQQRPPVSLQTSPGVFCRQVELPVGAVGLYVPAGSSPLPSTAIMLAEPARIAGCRLRVLCTPPRKDGRADPAVLYVARRCGVHRVFKLGGAQAIAAMAFGTQTVPRVHKIFGPGNAWVTAAKQLLATEADGVAFDLPAGPSEVLIIADDSASPEFVAADLLAQAEHSVEAEVILVATSREHIERVNWHLLRQVEGQRRRAAIVGSLRNARAVLVPDLITAIDVSNRYAPEHLILATRDPEHLLSRVTAAGSVFLGHWTPEVLGDYCSGANHVLPTNGYARCAGGLSLADFTRRMTVQQATLEGLAQLGPVAERLAILEGLEAHADAVRVRLRAARAVAS
ncbi:MAG: histidinol dehydrogenase [Steroidobacteraceae bacterium]